MAPNPIDFNKVFNANLAENPVALAAVLGIFGVYLILAVYARREDKKDIGKVLRRLLKGCLNSCLRIITPVGSPRKQST